MEGSMSNGTSKPRRALQLGGALIAVVALLVSITAIASAQTAQSRYYSGVITGPDFCIENSLGGPRTYPFDSPPRDGIADICSLPTTRRATVARQNAMELLALDFVPRFGQLYAYECTDVAESYGETEKEAADECAAPRAADAAGLPAPPVPASRVSPALAATWPSGFFSGPVVTSATFCLNRSLGGPVTYPLDTDGDGVANICSLPTTRRATVARQNALEQLARERDILFDALMASECARLIDTSFGETAKEARDECAIIESDTGRPLPGDEDEEDDTGTGGSGGTGGTGGTGGDDGADDTSGGSQRPTGPTQSVSSPVATNPGTYSNRAARNLVLAPGIGQITVSWEAVLVEGDGLTPEVDSDIYDSGLVFEYIVEYSTSSSMSNSRQLTVQTDGTVDTPAPPGWSCTSGTSCTITRLTDFTTYYVRVLANRGLGRSTGSGNSPGRDYWTPTLSITPGLAGPPTWGDADTTTDGDQPLYNDVFGEILAVWAAPAASSNAQTISNYRIQWGTSRSFANNCNTSSSCEEETVGTTQYRIMGLTNNRTYYVRVQAATSNGPGTWSLTETLRLANTDPDPGKPTNVTLSSADSGTSLMVNWVAPATTSNDPAPDGYRVQWRNVSDNENWSAATRQASASGTTHTQRGLDALDRYQVRVRAVTGKVAGPWSDTEEIILGVAGAPSITTIAPGTRDLTVTWTRPASNPEVNSIIIQWDTSSGFATNCVADTSCNQDTVPIGSANTPQTKQITGLNSNTVYYVRLRGINNNGTSAWSQVQSGEPGTLVWPTGVSASPISSPATNDDFRKLTVAWTSGNETGKPPLASFTLQYRRTGTTSWTSRGLTDFTDRTDTIYNCTSGDIDGDLPTATPGSGSYSCTLTGLQSDESYDVRIRARNSYGDGQWSETATGTPTSGKPDTPSISSVADVTGQSGRLTVTWTHTVTDPTPAVSSFQMRRCHTPTGGSETCSIFGVGRPATGNADEYQYTITGLTNDTEYRVSLRAQNTHGYSDWTSPTAGTPTSN